MWRTQPRGASMPETVYSPGDGAAIREERLQIERARRILDRLEEEAERAAAATRLEWISDLRRRLQQWEREDTALRRSASHLEEASHGLVAAADENPGAPFAPDLRPDLRWNAEHLRHAAGELRSTRRFLLQQRLAEFLKELDQASAA